MSNCGPGRPYNESYAYLYAGCRSTSLEQPMKTIVLEHYSATDKGFTTKAILLNSIPGYEDFESYVVLPNGKICSGKGGKFKRLNTARRQYALSYQRPFEKFYQAMVPESTIVTDVKGNLSNAVYVNIVVN